LPKTEPPDLPVLLRRSNAAICPPLPKGGPMTNETPTNVGALARAQDTIPMNRIVLLGTVLGPEGSHALVRLASGEVQRLGLGDTLDDGEIIAIEIGQLTIADGGRSWTLEQPGR
jgi:hypothetical protein